MAHSFTKAELDVFKELFSHFDVDGDGAISTKELKTVLGSFEDMKLKFAEEIMDEKLDAMIKEIDTDGDGKVSYEEFVKMLEKK
nr:PREDICTED: calmodulin [Anolis carolinensis]|eukprot:XP_016849883.1 PREDICTED: calmodulin [Anolis carolinensis]